MYNGFSTHLLEWHKTIVRTLPWKEHKDPYSIWLSEIILQQTRVEQGTPYYLKFKQKYPTVTDLASASRDEVYKMWEGLGYYSRANNLHKTAKYIVEELSGKFPATYQELLKLKGVGEYTAAAIASFAYDLPEPVVDGNVFRVLSRYFAEKTPVNKTIGKKRFKELAIKVFNKDQPANHNQAIMDLGALICTPKDPQCRSCPLNNHCLAYRQNAVMQFPVRTVKKKLVKRVFNYLLAGENDRLFIKRRSHRDIWKNLYDFPMIETTGMVDNVAEIIGSNDPIEKYPTDYRSVLSHQVIEVRFWNVKGDLPIDKSELKLFSRNDMKDLVFPRVINRFLQENPDIY